MRINMHTKYRNMYTQIYHNNSISIRLKYNKLVEIYISSELVCVYTYVNVHVI